MRQARQAVLGLNATDHPKNLSTGEIERRQLPVQIGVDGGVNLDTIAAAYAAGGEVLVTGSALYGTDGDLAPTVQALRAAATADH